MPLTFFTNETDDRGVNRLLWITLSRGVSPGTIAEERAEFTYRWRKLPQFLFYLFTFQHRKFLQGQDEFGAVVHAAAQQVHMGGNFEEELWAQISYKLSNESGYYNGFWKGLTRQQIYDRMIVHKQAAYAAVKKYDAYIKKMFLKSRSK